MSTVRPPYPAIDVHTHLFPDRLQAAVRRALTSMYGWSFEMTTEPEAFARELTDRGIERFVMLPYAHKPGMARSLNEWIARTAAELPGAIGFACVHQDDERPETILDAAFAAGLRGVKIHYQVQNVEPDDERLRPVYERLLALDLPMLVHAGLGPTDSGTVGAARFRRLMERYPELRACVAHMGAPEIAEFLAMLSDFPNLSLDTSGLGGARLDGFDLGGVADRILYGSDAPNIVFPYEAAITRITALGLGTEAERKIFRDNALRFLGEP